MHSNKEAAITFLKTVAFGAVRTGYDKFIAPNFIHHNQYFKGDRESLMIAMEEAHKTMPNKLFDVKYAYEDGNTVITHSYVEKETMKIAVVHIFRFENGKVVELWDLGQAMDPNSPNELGLF